MDKKQIDKQRRNEEKANVFRDSKRRLVYPINYTDQAYLLSQDNVGRVMLYDTRIVFAVLPTALVFGLLGKYLIPSLLLGLAFYAGFEIYFKKYFLPTLRVIKLKPEDYAYTLKPEVLKRIRQERLIRALLTVALLVLIVNFVIVTYLQGDRDLVNLVSSVITILLTSGVLVLELKDIFVLNKLIKNKKSNTQK